MWVGSGDVRVVAEEEDHAAGTLYVSLLACTPGSLVFSVDFSWGAYTSA